MPPDQPNAVIRFPACALLAALFLAGCSSEAPADAQPTVAAMETLSATPEIVASSDPDEAAMPVISPAGMGDARIGQPAPQGWKGVGAQISLKCRMLASAAVEGGRVMTDGNVVRRVSVVGDSPVLTERGVGIGTPEGDLRAAYDDLIETPHKFAKPPAKNLMWRPQANGPLLRFELDAKGQVSAIYAGEAPWIDYAEGCA